MSAVLAQLSATGTNSDNTTSDVTRTATWSVSDTTMVTVTNGTDKFGTLTIQPAGKIWGGVVGVTATLAPASIPGTGTIMVIASDSGSGATPLMPQLDVHWQALGLSPWGTYFGLQEPSGSMMMGSGVFQFALTASVAAGAGTPLSFQSTEPGWTRNFVVMTGTAASQLTWPSNFGPNTSNSWAMLCYAHVGMLMTTNEGLMGVLGASAASYKMSSDQFQTNTGQAGVSFNGVGDNLCGPITQVISDRVHPFLLAVNTSSMVALAATDVSICTTGSGLLSNFIPVNNNPRGLGGILTAGVSLSASYAWFAVCTGSIAEFYSDPKNAGSLLGSLGWNCHWASCPADSGTIKLPFLPFHWESLGLVPWTATWNIADAAGNFCTDNFWPGKNLNGFNLTAASVDAYRYPLAAGWSNGWARAGARLSNATSHRGSMAVVYGPPPNFDPTGSFAILSYAAFNNAAGSKAVHGVGANSNGTMVETFIEGNGKPVIYVSGSTVTGSQVITDGRVHPVLTVYDITNLRAKVYTDLENITGTFSQTCIVNSITASMGFGGIATSNAVACSGVYVYHAFTTGALAETLSDNGVASNFLKTLGWTIPW